MIRSKIDAREQALKLAVKSFNLAYEFSAQHVIAFSEAYEKYLIGNAELPEVTDDNAYIKELLEIANKSFDNSRKCNNDNVDCMPKDGNADVTSEMARLNVAELLKDCPKGTKLYSPLCGECTFDRLKYGTYGTIICKKQNGQEIAFTSEGYYMLPVFDNCECMIFPSKDQRDWSKFKKPFEFEDGDIIYTRTGHYIWISIFKENRNSGIATHVDYCTNGNHGDDFYIRGLLCTKYDIRYQRLATEKEKQKLFDAIEANGYKWNAETKTLTQQITQHD